MLRQVDVESMTRHINLESRLFFKVLMPVFNREKVVTRAIDSLRKQTFQDFCLVIVNDGSTDGSLSTAVKAAKCIQHPTFFINMQENVGVGAALNMAAKVGYPSHIHWITRLDSDDEYARDYLLNRYNAIQNNTGTELFYGGIRVLNGPDTVPDATDVSQRIPISATSQGATLVVRSDTFASLGGFDTTRYGEDYALLEKARLMDVRIQKLNTEDYFYYRDSENALTRLHAST